jgi:hypothetical protein
MRKIRLAEAGFSFFSAASFASAARLARHKLSRQTVTKMFENERGVIVIDSPTKMRKRRHRTIRVPHPVYLRKFGSITKAMRRKVPTAARVGRGTM